jgi:hypothetical protein
MHGRSHEKIQAEQPEDVVTNLSLSRFRLPLLIAAAQYSGENNFFNTLAFLACLSRFQF